jgi:hypothetical protein
MTPGKFEAFFEMPQSGDVIDGATAVSKLHEQMSASASCGSASLASPLEAPVFSPQPNAYAFNTFHHLDNLDDLDLDVDDLLFSEPAPLAGFHQTTPTAAGLGLLDESLAYAAYAPSLMSAEGDDETMGLEGEEDMTEDSSPHSEDSPHSSFSVGGTPMSGRASSTYTEDESYNSMSAGMDSAVHKPFAKRARQHMAEELTPREVELLRKEGFSMPPNRRLTKEEEKQLKRLRRKIKNKMSAQDSRKRKKQERDELEKR